MVDRRAHHLDFAVLPRDQTDDSPHQHRLATARGPDQAEDLAPAHVQSKMIDYDVATETNDEIAHPDGKLFRGFLHRYIPIDAKNTANNPSSTITRKIDLTTDVVVCLPSDSALPFTRRPSLHATMPITSAMNGAFMMPTWKWVTETASCSL